jgi:hypothetical protein
VHGGEPAQPGRQVGFAEHGLQFGPVEEVDVLLGDALIHQPTGGLAFGPRGTPHTFQNVGTAPAGLEDVFLDCNRRAGGPYDAQALAAAAQASGIHFTGPLLRLR